MKFILPITPKPQPGARPGPGKPAAAQAETTRLALTALCALLSPHRPERPLAGPLALTVTAYLPIPMSWPGKKIVEAERGRVKPDGRHGLDALLHKMQGGLTAAGFWQSEKQVVSLSARKRYNDGRGVRWEVEIREVK